MNTVFSKDVREYPPRLRVGKARRTLTLAAMATTGSLALMMMPSASAFGLASSVVASDTMGPGSRGAFVSRCAAATVDLLGAAKKAGGARAPRRRAERSSSRSLITCKVAPPRRYGSADWLYNMQNLPKSRLLYNIRHHLAFNTLFALLISLAHALTPQHIIDDLHVSPIPHSIMSGALGLLLVFRTNAAYNRFWEARKIWGNVVNVCRSLARLGVVSLGADSEEWWEMKEYLQLFPFLLKQHLQNDRIDDELDFSTLPPERVLALQEDPNPPLLACQIMSEIVARAYAEGGTGQSAGGRVLDFTSVTYRMEMEHCLSALIDALGMCERILTTPVPRGYSRHTSRFLTVYGLTLPLVLVPHTELFTAPVVGAVCWGLFSIEEIAYFIEQPFDPEYRQLDLAAFSEKIRRDVERMTLKSAIRDKKQKTPALSAADSSNPQFQLPWAIASIPPTTASVLHLHDDDDIVRLRHETEANHPGSAAAAKATAALFKNVPGSSNRLDNGVAVNGATLGSTGRSGERVTVGGGRVDQQDGEEGTSKVGIRGDYSNQRRKKKGWDGHPENDIIGP